MGETNTSGKKKCPLCRKEFAAADNYCPNDGSRLEPTRPIASPPEPSPLRDTDPALRAVPRYPEDA
jgi:hypothetical protein